VGVTVHQGDHRNRLHRNSVTAALTRGSPRGHPAVIPDRPMSRRLVVIVLQCALLRHHPAHHVPPALKTVQDARLAGITALPRWSVVTDRLIERPLQLHKRNGITVRGQIQAEEVTDLYKLTSAMVGHRVTVRGPQAREILADRWARNEINHNSRLVHKPAAT